MCGPLPRRRSARGRAAGRTARNDKRASPTDSSSVTTLTIPRSSSALRDHLLEFPQVDADSAASAASSSMALVVSDRWEVVLQDRQRRQLVLFNPRRRKFSVVRDPEEEQVSRSAALDVGPVDDDWTNRLRSRSQPRRRARKESRGARNTQVPPASSSSSSRASSSYVPPGRRRRHSISMDLPRFYCPTCHQPWPFVSSSTTEDDYEPTAAAHRAGHALHRIAGGSRGVPLLAAATARSAVHALPGPDMVPGYFKLLQITAAGEAGTSAAPTQRRISDPVVVQPGPPVVEVEEIVDVDDEDDAEEIMRVLATGNVIEPGDAPQSGRAAAANNGPLTADLEAACAFNSGYYARFFVEDRLIGKGGFGGVYLAHHTLDGVVLGTYAGMCACICLCECVHVCWTESAVGMV